MVRLLLALLPPLVLVLIGTWLLEANRDRLPVWLQRLRRREAIVWNAGIGLVISLSLLRWLLPGR